MRTKTYSEDIEVEGNRPKPSDRPDDYDTSGLWACIWANYGQSHFNVSRRGDNTPKERYHFRAERVTDSQPYQLKATPVERTTEVIRPRSIVDGWEVRYRHGRPQTKKESIGLEDLPEAVRTLLEDEEHVQLVESLYD